MCIIGEAADVFDEFYVTARKEHRCCECDAAIPKGCWHARFKVLSEGSWSSWRMHRECRALWSCVIEDACGGRSMLMLTELREELREHEELLEHDDEGKVVGATLEDILECVRDGYRATGEGAGR